jgi:hypothetical protein
VDNVKQFENDIFKKFSDQIGTKVAFASVYHPQTNGAIERANALIFEAIKKWLEGEKKGKWAEVMLNAIWSHNTSVSSARNFTPFELLFGAEAITPEEIKHQSTWTKVEATFYPSEVEEKDLLVSDRLKAIENLEKYQTEMKAWRDKKVKERAFDIGDLVLSSGKLQPKWHRPYIVTGKSRPGSYRLSDSEGARLPHSWNVDNLHCFYI